MQEIDTGIPALCGASRRISDAGATLRHRRDARGLTVIELLVTMAVFSALVGAAIPASQPNRYALWEAQVQLLSDFRLTRTDALTKGDHFRLEVVDATSYVERRLRFVGGVWVPDATPTRSRSLPAGITFTAGVGRQYEFNTRGLLIVPGAAETITLHNASTGHDRDITIWPSGQVSPA